MSEQTGTPLTFTLIIEAGEDTYVVQLPNQMTTAKLSTLLSTHPKVQAITTLAVTQSTRQVRQASQPA